MGGPRAGPASQGDTLLPSLQLQLSLLVSSSYYGACPLPTAAHRPRAPRTPWPGETAGPELGRAQTRGQWEKEGRPRPPLTSPHLLLCLLLPTARNTESYKQAPGDCGMGGLWRGSPRCSQHDCGALEQRRGPGTRTGDFSCSLASARSLQTLKPGREGGVRAHLGVTTWFGGNQEQWGHLPPSSLQVERDPHNSQSPVGTGVLSSSMTEVRRPRRCSVGPLRPGSALH